MSGLVGANPTNMMLGRAGWGRNNEILQEPAYNLSEPYVGSGRQQDVDILWTRGSFPQQPTVLDNMHQYWEWCFPLSGCQVRKVVTGRVIDANGNAVSGATVQLFNTATGLLVDTQVSASDGAYVCGDPNAVASFVIGYLAGSPDREGGTVNTITGV